MGSCVPLSLNLVENKVLIPNGCKCHGTEVSIGSYLREILACSIIKFCSDSLVFREFYYYYLLLSSKQRSWQRCYCCSMSLFLSTVCVMHGKWSIRLLMATRTSQLQQTTSGVSTVHMGSTNVHAPVQENGNGWMEI